MSPKIYEKKREWVKFLLVLSHPRLPLKVSQSVSQKNRPDRAKSNKGFSFPGPFLLKPRRSQVSLRYRTLAKVAIDPGKRAQVPQDSTFPKPSSVPFRAPTNPLFLTHPRSLFKVSLLLSQASVLEETVQGKRIAYLNWRSRAGFSDLVSVTL